MLEQVIRRRRAGAFALVWLILGMLTIGLLGEAERTPGVTDALPDDRDSTRVVELLEEFPQGDDSVAIVLFTGADGALAGALDPSVLPDLERLFVEARDGLTPAGGDPADEAPGGEAPGAGAPPTLIPSEDGTAAIGVIPIPGVGATEIADLVGELRTELREGAPDSVDVQVTGPAAIQADLAAVFEGADLRLLAATATVVAFLLIVTYRSPWLWLVPLTVVGVADRTAAVLATHTLALFDVTWDESTVGILSVLVFGAGTDYALLLISRYRDELKVEEDRYLAMRRALRRTSEAVLASSTTVVVGLLTLLLSAFPATRGLGLACAVGVVIAALAALVVLPAALVVFGRWVFWPRTPRVGQEQLVESTTSVWARVGHAVSGRPATLAVVTTLVLLALAGGLTQIERGLSESDQFLEKPEAIAAAERLAESFPAGSADPTVVLTQEDPQGVSTAVAEVDGVEDVRPAGESGDWTRLDAVLAAAPGSQAARDTVAALRAELAGFDATYVGGTEAESVDASDAATRDQLLLIPLILGLVIVALVGLLRSVVAPLLLVGTVVLTYLASLGLAWWLFTGVFGFERLDVGVPLLAFLFLVALGVDYNIFLVSRAAEEAQTHGAREGMLRSLTATGGVITSAGILLAAVFAVLGVLPLVVLAQLGTVICIGVLLDTLVVRTVLVPALAVRLGQSFWWPRSVGAGL